MERIPVKRLLCAAGLAFGLLAAHFALAAQAGAAAEGSPRPGAGRATGSAPGSTPAGQAGATAGAAKSSAPRGTGGAAKGAASASGSASSPASGSVSDRAAGPAHNTPKMRAGSVLKSDKLLPSHADLRSEAERRRDAELRKHFSRLAELDAVNAVAVQDGNLRLQEYVEQVRRKEVQRHQKVMMAMRRGSSEARVLIAGASP
jgi:hypothetical protein